MQPRARQNPAPFASGGWNDNNPFDGSQNGNLFGLQSYYGYPNGPQDIAPRDDAALKLHIHLADTEQASGRYYGLPPYTAQPIITPTSYLFVQGSPSTNPSAWFSGVNTPDWMDA